MLLPLALGTVAVLALASMSKVSDGLGSRIPKKSTGIVTFTRKNVFWRVNPKTGKTEERVEVAEKIGDLTRAASQKTGRPVSRDAILLASLMASETAGQHPLAKVAVAHAALTAARKKRGGLAALLAPNGKLGSQHGRYATTRNPPTKQDLELAQQVLTGKIENPVPGADQWDSPRAQDALARKKAPGYSSTSEQVAQKRIAAGKVAVYLPGVDPGTLRLWKQA